MADLALFGKRQCRYVSVVNTNPSKDTWPNTSLPEFVHWLNDHIQDVPQRLHTELRISFDVTDDSPEITLYYYRPETDEEMQQRLQQEQSRQAENMAKELKQLQMLLTKYRHLPNTHELIKLAAPQ